MYVCMYACRYNIAGTLVTGGRLVVYPELVRVFDVAREIGPSTLGLVPQLWAVLYVQTYMLCTHVLLLCGHTVCMYMCRKRPVHLSVPPPFLSFARAVDVHVAR